MMQHTCSLGLLPAPGPLHRPARWPYERVQLHLGSRKCHVTCAASNNGINAPRPAADSLRTPHSGYHWDGNRDQFFEGWYWKVSDCAALVKVILAAILVNATTKHDQENRNVRSEHRIRTNCVEGMVNCSCVHYAMHLVPSAM